MSFSPYVGFAGTAREAMTAYAAIFGASDLQITDFADAPEGQRPSGTEGMVMHAQFSAGPGAPLMGCDIPPGFGTAGMGGSSVFHAAPTVERATGIFAALSVGGQVTMPLAPSFWSSAFGMLTDRWGTRWMISVGPVPSAENQMIDHTGIATEQIAAAQVFYDAAFAGLGGKVCMVVPKEFTGGTVVMGYGRASPVFWLHEGVAGPGRHVALAARNRAEVDAFYKAAMAAGGRDNGAPGLRPQYHPNYYAAFVLDPDNNNIEAVCHNPA